MLEREEFRSLTEYERELLMKLLEADFPGKHQILEQVNDSVVREIDEEGSLEFKVLNDVQANVTRPVPIEGQFQDKDGTMIHVLIHVFEGRIDEMQIYKDDGSPIIQLPAAGDLEIILLN